MSKRQCPNTYSTFDSLSNLDNNTPTTLFSSQSSFTTTGSLLDHPFYHPTDSLPWNYHNVLGAAPMVRISTLPFRLACKTFGANMLYSEELVGMKLQHCKRITNVYDLIPNFANNNRENNNSDGGDVNNDNNTMSLDSNLSTSNLTSTLNTNPKIDHTISPITSLDSLTTTTQLTHFVLDKNIDALISNFNNIWTKNSTQGSYILPTQICDITDTNQLLATTYKYSQNDRMLQQLSTFSLNSELTTYPHERLVVQLGVGNSHDALNAALVVANDCRAIDINLGCPKLFSTQGLFGSELLIRPEIVEDIIKTLKRNINNPVTIKIRMLPDVRHTIDLIKRAESCGVEAIAVHARYKADRPRYQALPLEQMSLLSSIANVPLLYNGDIYSYHEIEQYKHICRGCWCSGADIDRGECVCGSLNTNANGVHGVLIGRGAMHNPSVFGHYLPDPVINGTTEPILSGIGDDIGLKTNKSLDDACHNSSLLINHSTKFNNNNNSNQIQLPPAIWDPISSLLSKCPTFNHFLPQKLVHKYNSQFTNPLLYKNRQKYPNNYQDEISRRDEMGGLLERYQYTPTKEKSNPRLQHYTILKTQSETESTMSNNNNNAQNLENYNLDHTKAPNAAGADECNNNYNLFAEPTWPVQGDSLFIPQKRNDYIELLDEIQDSITNRRFKTTNQTDKDSIPVVNGESTTTSPPLDDITTVNTTINAANDKDQPIMEKYDTNIEDYSCYSHRTPPYQYNDPGMNPHSQWSFGQSYLNSILYQYANPAHQAAFQLYQQQEKQTIYSEQQQYHQQQQQRAVQKQLDQQQQQQQQQHQQQHQQQQQQENDQNCTVKMSERNDQIQTDSRNPPPTSLNLTHKSPNMANIYGMPYHQSFTLPLFYPTALITLLSLVLSTQISNTKYIVQAMLKCNQSITKDNAFRIVNQSKCINDVARGVMALAMIQSCNKTNTSNIEHDNNKNNSNDNNNTSNGTNNNDKNNSNFTTNFIIPMTPTMIAFLYKYYHPQPVTKHEARPPAREPKQKK